jgi:hypothetical protein
MRKALLYLSTGMVLILVLTACGKADVKSQNESETKMDEFTWTKEALLRVRIDPLTLKNLEFAGALGKGEAKVQASNDPDLAIGFAVDTLPSQCAPISALLNGSTDLGDELKLTQFSETSSTGNALYQWVRTFPTTEVATQRIKEFVTAAPDCGIYSYTKSSGETTQYNLWTKILSSSPNSIIASGATQYFAVGHVGNATYFQWLIFDSSNLPTKAEMLMRTQELQSAVEALLSKEQRENL